MEEDLKYAFLDGKHNAMDTYLEFESSVGPTDDYSMLIWYLEEWGQERYPNEFDSYMKGVTSVLIPILQAKGHHKIR